MGLYSVNVTSHYEINYLNGPSKMGTLPDSQCRYIIATITGQTGESQVRGERQTLIWCLIMDVKEVHSTGSSCIPSIEILLEVCVLPSNLQKKIIFLDWDFFNHLAPDMQYETNELFCILNCVCPTIHIHFFMKYKLNGWHSYILI